MSQYSQHLIFEAEPMRDRFMENLLDFSSFIDFNRVIIVYKVIRLYVFFLRIIWFIFTWMFNFFYYYKTIQLNLRFPLKLIMLFSFSLWENKKFSEEWVNFWFYLFLFFITWICLYLFGHFNVYFLELRRLLDLCNFENINILLNDHIIIVRTRDFVGFTSRGELVLDSNYLSDRIIELAILGDKESYQKFYYGWTVVQQI